MESGGTTVAGIRKTDWRARGQTDGPPSGCRTPGVCFAPQLAMKLNKSWQFRKVYDEGAKLVGDYVVVFYYSNPDEDSGPRFGVVASKRMGGAVERNRAKRLLREAARHFAGKLNHRNIWVVLVARSAMSGRSSKEVLDDIGRALDSAGLITRST